jgi:hypothetical protein
VGPSGLMTQKIGRKVKKLEKQINKECNNIDSDDENE